MRLLLDTHIALWAIDAPHLLAPGARRAIDQAGEVAVSAVAIWEISIKHALREERRDRIRFSGGEALALFEEAGFTMLPVTPGHAVAVDALPAIHADPFDRLMIAQARIEPMQFLTANAKLGGYGYPVMLV